MQKTTKRWLIAATLLVLAGFLLFAAVLAVGEWDVDRLSTTRYETVTHEMGAGFSNLSVHTDTADIRFALSQDGGCRVVCYQNKTEPHAVILENDTLVIKVTNQKAWYDYLDFSFDSPEITVFLPKTDYATLSVIGSTGDIDLSSFTFEQVDISTSTGDIEVERSRRTRCLFRLRQVTSRWQTWFATGISPCAFPPARPHYTAFRVAT